MLTFLLFWRRKSQWCEVGGTNYYLNWLYSLPVFLSFSISSSLQDQYTQISWNKLLILYFMKLFLKASFTLFTEIQAPGFRRDLLACRSTMLRIYFAQVIEFSSKRNLWKNLFFFLFSSVSGGESVCSHYPSCLYFPGCSSYRTRSEWLINNG